LERSPSPLVAGEGATVPTTGIARAYEQIVAMNEALIIGALRQHELTEAAESLNAQLQAEIAARKKTAAELAEKARLLDLSTDAIFVRDGAGHILYWNHGAEELYGWSREEALGKISHELLHTEFPAPVAQIAAALHQHHHWSGELVHTKRDGQRITVLVRKTQDLDAQGRPAAMLENVTDITERKKMEDELRQARTRSVNHAKELDGVVIARTAELAATNRQLEAFVYSMAHDLRGPLRSMQGFSQLLVEEAGAVLSPTGRDYAERINHSAQFMDALLADLLEFSRVSHEHVELTPVDLQAVVASVLARLQADIEEKHGRVENCGPWPVVLAHEATLAQVLCNLVTNALKFVRPGVPPVVRLRTEDHGDYLRLWVEDNGIGVAPDHRAQIFRPFIRLEREKYAGTGIGLSIVQKGVERMGRQVGVESTVGEGSRFWIELTKALPAASDA
jgi:PAS domain S-box-containing protein